MNILITGASGFVGYHLAKRLAFEGHFVRCLVRKSSKVDLLRNLNVQLFEGDLLCAESLEGIAKDIDIVYHLAGTIYSRKRSDFNRGNILSTKNLLEELKKECVSNFVYVSSLSVYKPPQKKVLLNESSSCYPITIYGESKLKTEELIFQYFHRHNFPIVIIRAPIIYGSCQSLVLTKFFTQIIKQKKALIIGNGEYLRSFCYIDNFIDALILVGKAQKSIGEIYNISDKNVYTFNKLIAVSSKIIGSPIKIIRLPKLFGDTIWQVAKYLEKYWGLFFIEAYSLKTMTINLGCDISKIERDFAYCPAVGLEEGLTKTFKWILQEEQCGLK